MYFLRRRHLLFLALLNCGGHELCLDTGTHCHCELWQVYYTFRLEQRKKKECVRRKVEFEGEIWSP